MKERQVMINTRRNYLKIMQQQLAETSINDEPAIKAKITVIDAQKRALLQLAHLNSATNLVATK